MLKGVHTLLKGVLKEYHSFFNAGVEAGVPLKFLAMSGSGSATQKIKECWTHCTKYTLNPWSIGFNPVKVSLMAFGILSKIFSAHRETGCFMYLLLWMSNGAEGLLLSFCLSLQRVSTSAGQSVALGMITMSRYYQEHYASASFFMQGFIKISSITIYQKSHEF